MKRGLSRKNIKLLGVSAVFLIIFLGFTMVLVPISQTTTTISAEIKSMEDANAVLANTKTEYSNIKKNIEEIKTIGSSIDELFPSEMNNSNLISIVNRAAVGAGLKSSAITDMKFSPASTVGDAFGAQVTLSKTSDNNFSLRSMGPILGVDEADFEIVGSSTGCKFDIQAAGETGYTIKLTKCVVPVSKIKLKALSLTDANSQPLPAADVESSSPSKMSKLSFTFNINGPLGKLSSFLAIIKKNVPAVSISSMEVATVGNLTQMKLSAFSLVNETILTPEERKTK